MQLPQIRSKLPKRVRSAQQLIVGRPRARHLLFHVRGLSCELADGLSFGRTRRVGRCVPHRSPRLVATGRLLCKRGLVMRAWSRYAVGERCARTQNADTLQRVTAVGTRPGLKI